MSMKTFFGKHFQSMYSGSMVGMGAMAFAVMGYVIAMQTPDEENGALVELNPRLLASIFGEEQVDVEKAIRKLCAPDPESRSKEEEGRRLVRKGQFLYRVVNGAYYLSLRSEEERLLGLRIRVAECRARKKMKDQDLGHGAGGNGESPAKADPETERDMASKLKEEIERASAKEEAAAFYSTHEGYLMNGEIQPGGAGEP